MTSESDPTPPQGIPRAALYTSFAGVSEALYAHTEAIDDLTDIVGSYDRRLDETNRSIGELRAKLQDLHHRVSAAEPKMTPDRMLELSDVLWREAESLVGSIPLGTREQWSAVQRLRDSASNLHSAAVWLKRHEGSDGA